MGRHEDCHGTGHSRSADEGTGLYCGLDRQWLLVLHPFAHRTAAARAKGLTAAQHGEFLAVVGMANQTNALVNGLQIPVDPAFTVEEGP